MTEKERDERIDLLLLVTHNWTREAFDAMDDETLQRHYEEKIG